jgi:hypothetical protein
MAFGMHVWYGLFGLRRSQKKGICSVVISKVGGIFFAQS